MDFLYVCTGSVASQFLMVGQQIFKIHTHIAAAYLLNHCHEGNMQKKAWLREQY